MFCHILIGCPSSGKSTLAQNIVENNPNYRIVSTDKIREQLFGDENIQGNWSAIETEVFRQIEAHINADNPIIYDATNAKRSWRMGLLQHLNQYNNVEWFGWHLKTPLKTCLQWNQKRERKVPETVIKRMSESLKTFPPIAAEGFVAVYPLNSQLKTSLTAQFQQKLSQFSRSVINRQNRTQKIIRHAYSNLLDFERLMYLIHLLLTYPGIGNLQQTSPETLEAVVGKPKQTYQTELDEICAFMSKVADPIYADPEAISTDLQWLEVNGIIGKAEIKKDLEITIKEDSELPTHSYSDLETFERLIKMIRLIIHEPFIFKKGEGTLNSLVKRMQEEEILADDYRDRVRKDIEKVLKPYEILPEFPMKRGYFAGTAILSENDLIKVFYLLETQAKSLDDPIALQVYERFKQRIETSKLAQSYPYPVRAIHNRNIVVREKVSDLSVALKTEELERAIEAGQLLELGRIPGGGTFNPETESLFKIYPLQIVFHNIGWYLGFEHNEGENKGLLRFERLDRLFLGQTQSKTRSRSAQLKSLQRLITLYKSCGGIFLGNDPKLQQKYLSSEEAERKQIEITIEIWFTEKIFRFISEGTQRFPLKQMKMSQPFNRELLRKNRTLFSLRKTSDPKFPHRFRVRLPQWSLEDIDLQRWILGFGGEAKVVTPESLRETLKEKGKAILETMNDPELSA